MANGAEEDRPVRGFVSQTQLGQVREDLAVLRASLAAKEEAAKERAAEAHLVLDATLAALRAELAEVKSNEHKARERIRELEEATGPVVAAYRGQQQDSRDFNKSIKVALFTSMLTIITLAVIIPTVAHLLAGGH